jgi:hypothetical protein
MPKKYSKQQKIDALVQLAMYESINTVHQLTGISTRTLRRWRDELQQKNNPLMSEKTLPSDTKRSLNPENGHKHAENRHKTQLHGHNVTTKEDKKHNPDTKNDEIPENGHINPNTDIPEEERGISVNGLPDKTYPYPIEDDEHANTDQYEDFKNLREKLMQHAQQLADNLTNNDQNINLQTLALARILDRIIQLDTIIPQIHPNRVIRFEYLYNGSVHNVPPWEDAHHTHHIQPSHDSTDEKTKTEGDDPYTNAS